jgi:hypothetical protein
MNSSAYLVLKRASLAVKLHSVNTNGGKKVAKFKGAGGWFLAAPCGNGR